jgi:hypothetical protein
MCLSSQMTCAQPCTSPRDHSTMAHETDLFPCIIENQIEPKVLSSALRHALQCSVEQGLRRRVCAAIRNTRIVVATNYLPKLNNKSLLETPSDISHPCLFEHTRPGTMEFPQIHSVRLRPRTRSKPLTKLPSPHNPGFERGSSRVPPVNFPVVVL